VIQKRADRSPPRRHCQCSQAATPTAAHERGGTRADDARSRRTSNAPPRHNNATAISALPSRQGFAAKGREGGDPVSAFDTDQATIGWSDLVRGGGCAGAQRTSAVTLCDCPPPPRQAEHRRSPLQPWWWSSTMPPWRSAIWSRRRPHRKHRQAALLLYEALGCPCRCLPTPPLILNGRRRQALQARWVTRW